MFGKPKIVTVRLSELTTSPKVNRPLNPSRVDKLVKNWDETLFTVPVVAEQHGKYVILDGQHRVEAFRAQHADDPRIQVLVHYGLTEAECARMFVYLNENLAVRPFDKFEKLVFSGDDAANLIHSILVRNGLKLAQGNSLGSVQCVSALQRAYAIDKVGGYLDASLKVLIDAWGMDSANFGGALVEGVAIFLKNHGSAIDRKRLAKVMASIPQGPHGVVGRARGNRDGGVGSLAGNVAEVLKNAYNKRLRAKVQVVA